MNFVDQIISEIDKGIKFSLDNYQKENRRYNIWDWMVAVGRLCENSWYD